MATSTNTPYYGKCPAEVRLRLNLRELRLSPHDGQVTRKTQKQGRAPAPDDEAAVIIPHYPRRKWMMTKEEQFWKMSGQSLSIGMLFCLYIRLPHLRTTLWSPCQERGSWFVIDLTSLLTGRHESRTHGVAANTHARRSTLPSITSSGGESHGCDLSDQQPKLAASEEQRGHQTDD